MRGALWAGTVSVVLTMHADSTNSDTRDGETDRSTDAKECLVKPATRLSSLGCWLCWQTACCCWAQPLPRLPAIAPAPEALLQGPSVEPTASPTATFACQESKAVLCCACRCNYVHGTRNSRLLPCTLQPSRCCVLNRGRFLSTLSGCAGAGVAYYGPCREAAAPRQRSEPADTVDSDTLPEFDTARYASLASPSAAMLAAQADALGEPALETE